MATGCVRILFGGDRDCRRQTRYSQGIRLKSGTVPAAVSSIKKCTAQCHWTAGKASYTGISQNTCRCTPVVEAPTGLWATMHKNFSSTAGGILHNRAAYIPASQPHRLLCGLFYASENCLKAKIHIFSATPQEPAGCRDDQPAAFRELTIKTILIQ